MMHYLVDAYNLLFRSLKKRDTLEKTRQKLIEELNFLASQLSLNVTLVFDGASEPPSAATRGHFDALEIVYTPKNQTADEYIAEEVFAASKPAQITVVTNDRELAKRCQTQRSKILTIDQFLAFLMTKRRKKKKATSLAHVFKDSDSEVARLLAIFEKRLLEESSD